MASVVKYPNSQFWVASFYDADGKLRRCSTHQTDKKHAQATADLHEKTAKRKGSLSKIGKLSSRSSMARKSLPLMSGSICSTGWTPVKRR